MKVMPHLSDFNKFSDYSLYKYKDIFPDFDKTANKLAWFLGSNTSILLHTVIFQSFLILIILGFDIDTVMLVLTTIVSLEAIYLSIFIQRTTNKQTEKLERFVREIRYNTVTHLEEPLDKVIKDMREVIEQTHTMVQQTHSVLQHPKSKSSSNRFFKKNSKVLTPKTKI